MRDGYEGHAQGCRDGEEGDRCHAHEVGENEHGHALGNLGVSAAGGLLRVVNAQVYAYVTVADHQESDDVEDEHGHHVNLGAQCVDVHGQTDAHFAIAADPHQREQGNQQREAPARPHHGCHVVHPQPLVDVHGIGDGVPAFEANHSQCIYRQLAGKHGQKACYSTPGPCLPVRGVVVVLVTGVVVHDGDEHQVEPHAQVGEGQVTHEESGNGQLVVTKNDQNGQVTSQGKARNYPGETVQEGKAQQVLTRVKGVWLGRALDEGAVKTIKYQVWILKVDVVKKIHAICSGLSEEYTDVKVSVKVCLCKGQYENDVEEGSQEGGGLRILLRAEGRFNF